MPQIWKLNKLTVKKEKKNAKLEALNNNRATNSWNSSVSWGDGWEKLTKCSPIDTNENIAGNHSHKVEVIFM